MRGFRQIEALKLACFTEQGERERWEYLLCPPHLSLMCRYLKRSGSGRGCTVVAEMLSTCAHKGICSVLFGGPSFSVSVGNERGLLFKWMWQRLQWTISALSPPWTTLNCAEATWNKGLVLLHCQGPIGSLSVQIWATKHNSKASLCSWLFDNNPVMCVSCPITAEILAFKHCKAILCLSHGMRISIVVAGSTTGRFSQHAVSSAEILLMW